MGLLKPLGMALAVSNHNKTPAPASVSCPVLSRHPPTPKTETAWSRKS
jgi:hypothetical protein